MYIVWIYLLVNRCYDVLLDFLYLFLHLCQTENCSVGTEFERQAQVKYTKKVTIVNIFCVT